jgi:putative FmdB family regulatory protein
VPVYEYRCLDCGDRFERRRALDAADRPVCASGHTDVKRLFSVFAATRGGAEPVSTGGGGGGGCCGGGCGCG